MANVEKSISEVVDVLLHIVRTHVRWNQDLTHDEAVAKLEAARVHAVGADVVNTVNDAVSAVDAAQTGDVTGVVAAGEKTVSDGSAVVSDVVSMVKPNE